jgi:hypothetical protein
MPWPQSAAPDLHLERARDRVGRSRTAWWPTIGGGSARPWGGGGESYIPSQPYELAKNVRFRARFGL